MTGKQDWEIKAEGKRASILAGIPQEWRLSPEALDQAVNHQKDLTGAFIQQFLDETEKSIVNKDSVEILEEIRNGNLSAVNITKAFCKTAAIAHQMTNCLHEVFFEQAIQRAQELDTYLADHKTTIGPLHGLPISLKDQFHVKGVDTTMGYIGHIGSNLGIKDPSLIHKTESQITTDLLSLGAVLYCKTSVIQTLLHGETENNIIGKTVSPLNRLLSCGGSSGGEGALIALRGSTLGVGTDIGGSVRIPASFNGLYAIKPSTRRLPYRNAANAIPGQTTYPSTLGFLSTSVGGLGLGLRAVLGTEPWVRDPGLVPIPFREDVFGEYLRRVEGESGCVRAGERPLKFGVLWTDGVAQPHPPITRGLKMIVDSLKKAGHEVVEWTPPSHQRGADIHLKFFFTDGNQDVQNHLKLSGEPLIPGLQGRFDPQPQMSMTDFHDATLAGIQYEEEYSDYWNSTGEADGHMVDAVIMPTAPTAAVIPGKYYHLAYSQVANILNYSATVIPVTRTDKEIDRIDDSYKPTNEVDKLNYEAYDPDMYHGSAVGIQLVGRKYEDEKMLAITQIVDAALKSGKQ